MNIEELENVLAHDLDADWIIALWLYIHGVVQGPKKTNSPACWQNRLRLKCVSDFQNSPGIPLRSCKSSTAWESALRDVFQTSESLNYGTEQAFESLPRRFQWQSYHIFGIALRNHQSLYVFIIH